MYRVLLVDDEPLILSGIKFMIDWPAHNCQIIGAVRNGQKALEVIREQHPDIVICDISMPVLSGIELLEKANVESPETVFIMLTNHPDFEFAKHSLQNRAVDYLLKSQLDSDKLAASLSRACEECKNRRQLASAVFMGEYQQSNEQELIKSTISFIMQAPQADKIESALQLLASRHMLEKYSVIYLPLDTSQPMPEYPEYDENAVQDNAKLLLWQKEVIEKIAESSFSGYEFFSLDKDLYNVFLFCWKIEADSWEEQVQIFTQKLLSASNAITRLPVQVFSTPVFAGKEHIDECKKCICSLRNSYYLFGGKINQEECQPTQNHTLGLVGLGERLAAELKAKHAVGCTSVLERVIKQISQLPHEKNKAIWFCGELVSAVESFLGAGRISSYRDIESLATRQQVVHWLEHLKKDLAIVLAPSASGKIEFLEKARQYVRDNVNNRILLQNAADYANVSPGYLSTQHNKKYNQKFVDYIHQVKMERACQIIQEGRYRISEIAYMLSFENAYYFTRVFKRCMGMTPSEYQKTIFQDNHEKLPDKPFDEEKQKNIDK